MTGKMFKMCAICAAVIGVILSTELEVRASITFRTVALTDSAAPNTSPDVVFSSFGNPSLNEAGQIVFVGRLKGPDVDSTNNTGIWSEGSGELRLVARDGNAAPNTTSGTMFNDLIFSYPAINGVGKTAFTGSLTGTGINATNNVGIWSEGNGSLALVARTGSTAPGTDIGVVYSELGGFSVLNDAGQTAFQGTLTGPDVDNTNNAGIWSEDVGSLNLVARTGEAAAGVDPSIVYSNFFSRTPVLNSSSQTVFISNLSSPGVDSTDDRGIWAGVTSSLQLIARRNEASHGTDPGVVYGNIGSPVINEVGQIAFWGALNGPGVDSTNSTGIWSDGSGTLDLVVRTGDAAPGTSEGIVFRDSLLQPRLNSAGHIAFLGTITGPGVDNTNGFGIWSGSAGHLKLVARKGDPAPGTEPGVIFNGLPIHVFNGVGQSVFIGRLTGPGIDNTNDEGYWGTDANGQLKLIIRNGDQFDVNDDPLVDDFRTIRFASSLFLSNIGDGRPSTFNDASQLVISIGFTDGSQGVFVATIPEPGSVTVFIVGAGLILGKRR